MLDFIPALCLIVVIIFGVMLYFHFRDYEEFKFLMGLQNEEFFRVINNLGEAAEELEKESIIQRVEALERNEEPECKE